MIQITITQELMMMYHVLFRFRSDRRIGNSYVTIFLRKTLDENNCKIFFPKNEFIEFKDFRINERLRRTTAAGHYFKCFDNPRFFILLEFYSIRLHEMVYQWNDWSGSAYTVQIDICHINVEVDLRCHQLLCYLCKWSFRLRRRSLET